MGPAPIALRSAALAAFLLAPGAGRAMTLGEAQAVLLRDNPDLAVLRLETERAAFQVAEARAAWLPSLDAAASYGYATETSRLRLELPFPPPSGTRIDRRLGDHDRAEAAVEASYALFTGFSRGNRIEAQRLGVRAREAQWRAACNQMSLRLAALFYAWQLASSQAAYQEKLLGHARELERQLQDFVKAGTAVRSRLLAAQARSLAAQVDMLAAGNARDSLAYEVLAFLGRRDEAWDSAEIPRLSADTAAPAAPAWEQPAGAPRPETQALDLGAAQARLGARSLAGQRWPQVFGSAGWHYADPGLDLAGEGFMGYGTLGVQARWNLFDGARNRSQRLQLDAQARGLEEQKRKLEQDWRKSMAVARLQFGRWTSQYEAARSSRDAARAAAADVRRQWEAGVATEADWLDARNGEARAELAMEQARAMQKLARLQWEYAAGKELRF